MKKLGFHHGQFNVIRVEESESSRSYREIWREKITPDLVCKLSVQEMESPGVAFRRDIMALRIECATFGGEALRKVQANCGAPSFSIPKCVLLESVRGRFHYQRSFYHFIRLKVLFTGG